MTNSNKNAILLGSERTADFILPKNRVQSRLEKSNRFSLTAEMHPFLLEVGMFDKVAWRKKYYKENKKSILEINKEWHKTKKGVLKTIFFSQISNSKQRGHSKPEYSNKEFYAWCLSQPLFHILYDNWVKGGFKRMDKPSTDRIDNSKGYSFSNIRLMTYKENYYKELHSRKGSFFGTNGKPIIARDAKGRFLAWFCSIKFAGLCIERDPHSIYQSINKKYKVKGMYFSYVKKQEVLNGYAEAEKRNRI